MPHAVRQLQEVFTGLLSFFSTRSSSFFPCPIADFTALCNSVMKSLRPASTSLPPRLAVPRQHARVPSEKGPLCFRLLFRNTHNQLRHSGNGLSEISGSMLRYRSLPIFAELGREWYRGPHREAEHLFQIS